jgi:hypothetical protein
MISGRHLFDGRLICELDQILQVARRRQGADGRRAISFTYSENAAEVRIINQTPESGRSGARRSLLLRDPLRLYQRAPRRRGRSVTGRYSMLPLS